MRWLIENPNDVIQSHLKNGNFYDAHHFDIIKNYIKKNDVIIDIGANVGNYTVYFSKFTPAKLIYVIEPIPVSYKMLLCNIALNYCHNVNVDYIGLALGNFKCIGYPFTVYGKDNLGSTTLFNEEYPEAFIKNQIEVFGEEPIKFPPVQIIKGDSIFSDKKIDFIKVDAEGMDLVILDGLKETINKNRPNVFIEIINAYYEDFNSWLESNDYIIAENVHNKYYNPDDPNSGKNYMVVPI